jgi:hypothetical protein
MKYLRQLFRFMFGTTSTSFNDMQRAEVDELMEKHDEARGVYITDMVDQIEASQLLKEKVDLKIARDELELTNLLGL